MTRLKPYPEYKDSGVPWLGEIPTHWGIERAKGLFEHMQRSVRPQDEVVTCFRDGMVTLRKNRRVSGFTESLKEIGYQGVRCGDLVIHAMDAFAGAIGVSDSEGKCTPVYSVCQPKRDLDVHYYAHIVREMARTKYIEALARGIRERSSDFRFEMFASQYLPVPSPSEQRAIARFLDYHDRLTRRYIRAQRRLIELLTEQKQALIQQAVTRGLDPHVKLKPSGIEWLGEIPEHWEVQRLKFLTSHIVDCLHATPEYVADGKYPAIRTADVKVGRVDIVQAKRVNQEQYMLWASRLVPQAGDILYTREGERYGLAALVPENVALCISQRMMLFRIRKPHRSDFLMWQLNCPHVYAQAAADVIGATSPHVNIERIRNYVLVVPSPDEQEKIAASIEAQCKTLEMLQVRASRETDLIREYRIRLIADVVTGKLDVRDVAPKALLPDLDEAGDMSDLDDLEEDAKSDDLGAGEMNDADD